MAIKELLNSENGNTLLMVTPSMLNDFAATLIREALEKLQKEEERTYTPKEFSELLGVDKSTLWRWNQEGLLKKTIIGGKVYYKCSDLKRKEG